MSSPRPDKKSSRSQLQITDNLERMLEILPSPIRRQLEAIEDDLIELIEIVIDLGRQPQARFENGRFAFLSENPVYSSRWLSVMYQSSLTPQKGSSAARRTRWPPEV